MCRCLVDVCPVEKLERSKSETLEVITQTEESPEPPPPPPPPPLEPDVQPEADEEDDARAKSPSPVVSSAVKSPSPVVSPVETTQPETAASGSSPPAVLQVIKTNLGRSERLQQYSLLFRLCNQGFLFHGLLLC